MKRQYKLGIPYMGSKRKIARPIMDYILKQNQNATIFYDVFGGGVIGTILNFKIKIKS